MTNNKTFKYFNTAIAAAVVASGVAVVAPQTADASELKFTDVKAGDYYYEAVMNLAERGIVKGYNGTGTYGPENNITRGQVAVILANALGLETDEVTDPGFKDVPKSHDYYGAIAALANAGHISGYEDDTYKPNEKINRYHMALILASAFNLKAKDVNSLPFTDVMDVYKDKIAALYDNGVTAGKTPTTFGGNQKVTRGQMALFIVAAEKAAYPAITVSEIKDSKVLTVDGKEYTYSEDVAAIFAEANYKALENADMGVIVENGEIVDVYFLAFNNAGIEAEPVVFDGGDSFILGDLVVNADWLEVKNLTVLGDLYITSEVVNSFSADMLEVDGDVYVEEIEEVEQSPVASLTTALPFNNAATNAKLNFVDSTVNTIETERNNLEITSNTAISEVKVSKNVNAIQLNAAVEAVTVNNAKEVQISGTGSINKVTVAQAAQITLNVPGQVKELVVANKDAKVSLGENVTVEKLVVPTESDYATIIDNYENVKGNITGVEDEAGAVIDTTAVEASTIEELQAALADTHVKTINVTADIKNLTERIVIDRAVTINGGGHTISFTDAINDLAYGSRQGIVVMASNVAVKDLNVQLTEKAEWQGAYAVQVYNAQNVAIHNLAATGADAGLLVNGSKVKLTGTIDVSGNEFGGIESSIGSDLTEASAIDTTEATLVNTSEAYGLPTIWEDKVTGTVQSAEGGALKVNDAVKDGQVQYYLTDAATTVEVETLAELQAALQRADVKTINLAKDIEEVASTIVVDRAVTIEGNNHTISFTDAINGQANGGRQGIVVLGDDVTINNLAVQLTEEANWQGVYAVQVYNAEKVVLNNFTGTGADAAILVNASQVDLTGTTTVSGNEFGGIEVSKGTEEGLSNSVLNVTGTIANESEAAGEPTIWVVHNLDNAKTAQGTVSGSALDTAVVNYIDKTAGYQTQYYTQKAPVQAVTMKESSTSLNSMNLAAIEVTAQAENELYELELDHNIAGLPEFSVYASEENPYGSDAAKAQFEEFGVDVAYDKAAKKWTITFGTNVSKQLVAQKDVTFYVVVADEKGYTFGSMYNTAEENTFKLAF
ncbi:S-layer homology domain-containing protein [Ureibacillus chungkukjangi]|uniref:S-layer homology domain-containing protein n=1 Tax=Ureibacillus chungkukjangi TaxID=1202712 RepID=UPI00203D4531|nr:S-layer homology domain-containing protein [Ureibacillus chungkukjangi]MCM3389137.1 S-layer homology domain-containing protein [Ureibacillus chungkukjangi]